MRKNTDKIRKIKKIIEKTAPVERLRELGYKYINFSTAGRTYYRRRAGMEIYVSKKRRGGSKSYKKFISNEYINGISQLNDESSVAEFLLDEYGKMAELEVPRGIANRKIRRFRKKVLEMLAETINGRLTCGSTIHTKLIGFSFNINKNHGVSYYSRAKWVRLMDGPAFKALLDKEDHDTLHRMLSISILAG